jgi:hypothetical protein
MATTWPPTQARERRTHGRAAQTAARSDNARVVFVMMWTWKEVRNPRPATAPGAASGEGFATGAGVFEVTLDAEGRGVTPDDRLAGSDRRTRVLAGGRQRDERVHGDVSSTTQVACQRRKLVSPAPHMLGNRSARAIAIVARHLPQTPDRVRLHAASIRVRGHSSDGDAGMRRPSCRALRRCPAAEPRGAPRLRN